MLITVSRGPAGGPAGGPAVGGICDAEARRGGFMPIKKPRGLRGLVLLAKEWSGDSGLLARAAAHRHHGEGESAEEETVGRGLRDGGGGCADDPIAAGGAR